MTIVPSTIVAGDTVAWVESHTDYPVPTWTLTYAFRLQNGSGKLDVTASPSGTDFSTTISAAQSSTMKPGLWVWAAYVTNGAERHQVGTGTVVVAPNLAILDASADLRSSARKAYENAEAAWLAFGKAKSVTLNGRTYTDRDAADLIVYVDRCRNDYASELQAEQMAKTGINPRHIGVRFGKL